MTEQKGNKKMVDAITPMEEDFAKWYTDIVKKAELMDYTNVRGCMVIQPYGFAIWENIQRILDTEFKELGHENISLPMFIPESLLQKEKDHVEGLLPKLLGLLNVVTKYCKKECVFVQLLKRYSATIMRK